MHQTNGYSMHFLNAGDDNYREPISFHLIILNSKTIANEQNYTFYWNTLQCIWIDHHLWHTHMHIICETKLNCFLSLDECISVFLSLCNIFVVVLKVIDWKLIWKSLISPWTQIPRIIFTVLYSMYKIDSLSGFVRWFGLNAK